MFVRVPAERRRADDVLAARLRERCANLGLLEYGDDLAICETGFLHGTSSGKSKRKFHFWRQLTCGGLPFVIFGECLAAQRKAQVLTQVQLAGLLDVSQQAFTAYESGQRREPISMLPALTSTLGVTVEALIGMPTTRTAGKRGPQSKIAQQLQ